MKKGTIRYITEAGMIGALYVVLTMVFQAISFGEMQIRIAEALTILPYFTPAAVPGIFIGCFLANIFGGGALLDIIVGSLSTLLAAYFSYKLRKHKYLVPLPPIIGGIIFVPLILRYAYGVTLPIPLLMLSIGIGQFLSCGVLGMILLTALDIVKGYIFKTA